MTAQIQAKIEKIALDMMGGNNNLKRDLISEGWKFEWSNTKSFGDCTFGGWQQVRIIRLSRKYLEACSVEHYIDTITHEMAHAICFEDKCGKGHDAGWKRVHRALGGSANRTSPIEDESKVKSRYVVYIDGTDEVIHRMDKLTRRYQPTNIRNLYLRNRRAETEGKLRVMTTQQWEQRTVTRVIEPKPAMAAKAPAAPKAGSKKVMFAIAMEANNITVRKDAIAYAIANLDMTKAGASTYWANYNKGQK